MNEQQVEQLVFNLNKAKITLIKARSMTLKAVLDWMTKTAIPFCKKQAEATSGEYKKTMIKLLNASQSLLEGLTSGDASLADAADLARDFKIAAAYVETLYDAESRKQPKPAEGEGQDNLFKMTTESEPTIRKYSIYEKDLPRNLFSKLFTVVRMPIIPLVDPPLNFEKLRRSKISDDHISFYPVIKNQPVLGLNPDWIQDTFKGKSEDAIEYVIDALKDRFGKNHQVVGRPVHTGRVVWYWIPSVRDIDRIRSASSSGKLAVNRWGFAFNV